MLVTCGLISLKGRLSAEHYQLMNEMAQNIYNSIREILLCDEDIDFCCKLLLKITFNCDDWKWIQNVCIDIINSNREKEYMWISSYVYRTFGSNTRKNRKRKNL